MRERIVITGLGLCTPVGNDVETVWANLLAGRSGIGPVTLFDTRTLPTRIAGEVKNLNTARLQKIFPALATVPDRKVWLGAHAAAEALADAGLPAGPPASTLLSIGVCLEVFAIEHVAPAAHAENVGHALACEMNAPSAPRLQIPLNALADLLGDHYQFDGPRLTNCSACAAGAQAVGEAFRRLRTGEAEVALAGATDSSLTLLGLGGFSLLHILSTENDTPHTACRPFDASRQGTVLSEGAAFLVLETLSHAQRRQARILAEVIGYASSMDAFRVTDPEPTGRGAALSMTKAIKDAGLIPTAIDAVNAHGTGTPKNDITETRALHQVLGPHARQIPVTANKSMTGHMIAASGAVEAAASVLTLARQQISPTINLSHPDPACDLDYVPSQARAFAGRTVLSNSFGFGGQNATLVFRRYEGVRSLG